MENNINKRILEFYNYLIENHICFNVSDFARRIGLNRSVVSTILHDRYNTSNRTIARIQRAFPQVNYDWLLTGKGNMLLNDSAAQQAIPATTIDTQHTPTLPLIPIEAVVKLHAEDNIGVGLQDCEQYHIPDFVTRGAEFLIRVSDSSMCPKYSNGDILACKRVREVLFFQWGKIYVIDSSQGCLVKRLYEDKDNKDNIICVSDNKKQYPPFSMPKSNIRSLSIVVGVIRME